VGKIIEIYNPNPWMTFGGMGSQKLDAPNVEYIANNDSHPGAQFSEQFHTVVKNEVARLAALDSLQTAKLAKPSQLAKLSPPKETQSSHLAFVSEETSKRDQTGHEQTKNEQPKHEQKAQAIFADAAKPQAVFAEAPKPQPVFADAFLTSANAGNLFVQRTLTISDMKDYVKRNYSTAQTVDLTR
jgi:hypothetical protein